RAGARGWRASVPARRVGREGYSGKRLQGLRSELVERSFAHVCETGGGRRSWLRGLMDVAKRYAVQVAGVNLGLLQRQLFGVGKPRALQGCGGRLFGAILRLYWLSELLLSRRD